MQNENNDLISREALKEEFNHLEMVTNNSSIVEQAEYKMLMTCIGLIDNVPTAAKIDTNDIEYKAYCKGLEDGKKIARPQGEWIPVSERLPEEYKKVLVSDVFGVYIGEFIDAEENWGGKHFINEHGMHSKSVVAWQPLPEPYQKGGAE